MKKILALIFCGLFLNLSIGLPVLAVEELTGTTEHLKLPKKLAKKTPVDTVLKTETQINLTEFNTLEISFAQDFEGKTARVGDIVPFLLKEGLKTVEGTTILPEATKIIAQINEIEQPKMFNKSGKIYLDFKYIETPDGKQIPIQAELFSKKDYLYRGKLNAIGKGFGSTFGGAAVGTAAGCGIGAAAGGVIIGGFAIGLPIGLVIGLIPGLITPGLNYRAESGDTIYIQLSDTIVIEK